MIPDPSSPNLLRYTQPTHRRWLIDDGIGMWVHPDGEWVMYRDHVARLAQLEQEQATLHAMRPSVDAVLDLETPSLNYFDPEHPPQNCDAKLWRLICLRVHALHEENERLRARVAAPTPHPQEGGDKTTEDYKARAQRVFEAVVYAYEGREVPADLLTHGMVQRGLKFRAAAAHQERTEPPIQSRVAAPTPETPKTTTRGPINAAQSASFTNPPASDSLVRRLTEWLVAGGYFNPGPMSCANENATRELILDVRDVLVRVADEP